jgi:Fic family protein
MKHGLDRMRGGFPLSLRLLREIHEVLLSRGRGEHKTPGEFRNTQNWIGGTRPGNATYVPPPADELMSQLDNFEKFLHAEPHLPVLVKAALAHVQFESIHPFLDGNGRLGRLLITLLLCAEGVLREPVLYLSLFFKQNRQRYYDLLQEVRLTGNWEIWIEFFLEAVAHTANQAVDAARQTVAIFEEDRAKIEKLGRPAASALRVHHYLQRHPITSIAAASKNLGISVPTITASIEHLQRLDIVKEISGKLKGRQYVYTRYIDILTLGTEPLPPA